MLRNSTDVRTLAYLAFTVGLSIVQWRMHTFNPALYLLALFMAVTVAVISHNTNHVQMWKSKPLNLFTRYVIALYYGHPAVAWVPTHNQVHHKLVNRPGDSSRGPKWFKTSHLAALLVYPSLTGIEQGRDIKAYFKRTRHEKPEQFWSALSEYVVFFGVMAGLLLLDWKKAILFFVIPQQFSIFVIQIFNYVQHVEAEEGSRWNHSRNFVSPVLNALLFNNGYHTVHHLKPGVHWSDVPKLHAEYVHEISPALLERSWWAYMGSRFLLHRKPPAIGVAPELDASVEPAVPSAQ